MKRVFAHQGRAILRDVPEPDLRPGEVLVQTAYSAISAGTESWIIRSSASPDWTTHEYPDPNNPGPQYRDPAVPYRGPQPRSQALEWSSIGYSNAGRVIAVSPEVADLKVGDRVACSGSQCAWHAERVAVPRNLVAPGPGQRPPRPGGVRHARRDLDGGAAAHEHPLRRGGRRLRPWPARPARDPDGALRRHPHDRHRHQPRAPGAGDADGRLGRDRSGEGRSDEGRPRLHARLRRRRRDPRASSRNPPSP